jgi:small subunit ribosomal protein S9
MKSVQAQGKRKRAVARAVLTKGTGKVKINGISLQNWSDSLSRLRVIEPFRIAGNAAEKVNVSVTVNGGGVNGQSDAVRLAVARALVVHDGKLKQSFDDYDRLLLVADVRRKEVCKPNDSKARAKRQKSYR